METLNIYEDVNYAQYSLKQLEALDVLIGEEMHKTSINISYHPDLNKFIRAYVTKHFGGLPKLNDRETIDAIVTSYVRDKVKPQFSAEERAKDEDLDAFPYYGETYDLWFYSLLYLILEEANNVIDTRMELLLEAEETNEAA